MSVSQSTIYVIVPVYNRRDITRQFLWCVEQQRYRAREVVLVDDGSTDGTEEMVRRGFPEVRYMRGDGTYFWTKALNAGLEDVLLRASDTDYVLVINDDLEFDADYFDRLLTAARAHPNTIIGSVVVDIRDPDSIVDGGRIWNWWTAKLTILNQGRSLSSLRGACPEVSTLTGRGVIFPVGVFRQIGIYDDVGSRHKGDTELPVRAARAGWGLRVSYDAVVRNHVDKTFSLDNAPRLSLGDWYAYFFGIRSSANLGYRYFFARRTMQSRAQFASFLFFSVGRVTCRFIVRLRPPSNGRRRRNATGEDSS